MKRNTQQQSKRNRSTGLLRRRRLPIIIVAAFVLVATSWFYVNTQSNKASAANYICLQVSGECINGNANPIRLDSAHALHYTFIQLGTNGGVVSSSKSWPFNPGSNMNAHYNGHKVYLLYQPNGTSCLGYDTNTNPAQVDTWNGCGANSSKKTWWVTSGGWLVNVGRTNEVGDTYPSPASHMIANCTGANCKIIVANGTQYADKLENWFY